MVTFHARSFLDLCKMIVPHYNTQPQKPSAMPKPSEKRDIIKKKEKESDIESRGGGSIDRKRLTTLTP